MFTYEAVTGLFAQDDPLAHPDLIGAVPPRFGLLDDSDMRWATLTAKLRELNASAGDDASYKLIFFGRHGQGHHNVAESKYGTGAWNAYWAMLYGDGELTWGPDPELTAIGKDQAVQANGLWKVERRVGIPIPERMYCSPMTRAMDTNVITFQGISDMRPLVLENCREVYGAHTCDKRNTRTHIQAAFPQFDIEKGFTEEDELWEADSRETGEHVTVRAQSVLDSIFRDDVDVLFISITAHGGIINGFLNALGRERYPLPTGGVLPVVVKAKKSIETR